MHAHLRSLRIQYENRWGGGGAIAPRALILGLSFFNAPYTRLGPVVLAPPSASSPADPPAAQRLVLDATALGAAAFPSYSLRVDTSAAPAAERGAFGAYLCSCDVQVDVWDADSLLPLGTATVALASLARQQARAVGAAREYDVVRASPAAPGATGDDAHAPPVAGTPLIDARGAARGCAGESVGRIQIILTNVGSEGGGGGGSASATLREGAAGDAAEPSSSPSLLNFTSDSASLRASRVRVKAVPLAQKDAALAAHLALPGVGRRQSSVSISSASGASVRSHSHNAAAAAAAITPFNDADAALLALLAGGSDGFGGGGGKKGRAHV